MSRSLFLATLLASLLSSTAGMSREFPEDLSVPVGTVTTDLWHQIAGDEPFPECLDPALG